MIRSVCKKFNNLCFCKAHEQGINVFFDSTLLEKGCKSMRFFCRIFITGYDEIYQEGLMAYLSLEQVDREKKILDFKTKQKK